jgi:cytochrome c
MITFTLRGLSALTAVICFTQSASAEMIHLMARKGDVAKVMAQIDKGVPVDLPSTKNTTNAGVTPLYVASQFGKVEVVEALLAAGAVLASKGESHAGVESNGTPLHVAASWGQADVVRVLLKAGADPASPDNYLGPPLHVARAKDRQDVVDLLLAAGATNRIDEPSISEKLASADVEKGKARAGACKFCHRLTLDDEKPSQAAPDLWDVVGRPMGSVAGFDYSDVMRERGEVWDYDALNSFLARPFEYLPGTKMAIIGIVDVDERANLMAYLRTLSDTPAALP